MAYSFPAYVINLDRAAERLRFIDARLRALGVPYRRIAAVDGAQLAEAERSAFAAARPRDGQRGWRPGQIGCFLSHQDAWRCIAAADATLGLVLEDDLHLSADLPALLARADWIPADADIVRLESTGQWLRLGPAATSVDGRAARRVRSSAWGAGAYVLAKGAAARLLATDPASHSPIDDFLFNTSSPVARALTTYQLVPALASQDKFTEDQAAVAGFSSDIETDRVNGRLPALAAWRRAITSTLRGKTAVRVR